MSRIQFVLESIIETARKEDYSSFDISNLLQTRYYALSSKLSAGLAKKVIQKPYKSIIKHYPDFIRKISSSDKQKFPQSHAFVIRGYLQLLKKEKKFINIEEVFELGSWLIENRSNYSKHFAWGQPFTWYSRMIFPKNIPRATVSSQVAWAFLDLFEFTGDDQYLDIVVDVCYLFKNDFNYTEDVNGNICLSYTTVDKYHIHNASMLAAAIILRVARITKNRELDKFGRRLVNFTIGHQNKDGSFYYWAPPDKLNYMIDNYHTGFVLESLKTIVEDTKSEDYLKSYQLGMEFYRRELFDGIVPKLSTKKLYPIDIQSCAQSILTFTESNLSDSYRKTAIEIADFSISSLYIDNKKHFGYRMNNTNSLDESYYFRWGDAWMIRALAQLV